MVVCFILWMPRHSIAAESGDIDAWQLFERRVRDGEIGVTAGRAGIARWAEILEQTYPPEGFDRRVFFPLKGYGLKSVGGKNGEGYQPAGYEFLGGNRHKGHPAQDIFIHDRNQNGLDDQTGRPAEILALADGVVLSVFAEWAPDEASRHIRGGNYVWIYHPALKVFSYYAHLKDVNVDPGDKVAGGTVIATMGRTGTNACLSRSPTHLHVMLLRAKDMAPVNPYPMFARRMVSGGVLQRLEACGSLPAGRLAS
jgi:murein DD-endopeptidase MepM/ murein hydrolase activator NlpD